MKPRHYPRKDIMRQATIDTETRLESGSAVALEEHMNVDKMYAGACSKSEAWLANVHGLPEPTRSRGGQPVLRTRRLATQYAAADGALDRDTRRRKRLCNQMRSIIFAMEGSQGLACLPWPQQKAWEKIRHQVGADGIQAEALTLHRVLSAMTGSQKAGLQKATEARVKSWRERIQTQSKHRPTVIFESLRPQMQGPAPVLQRADGTMTAEPDEMDGILRGEHAWGGVFQRYKQVPEPQWDVFLARYGSMLATPVPMEIKPITVEELRWALQQMSVHSSSGMEGWAVHELRVLPSKLLILFVNLLNEVETKIGRAHV